MPAKHTTPAKRTSSAPSPDPQPTQEELAEKALAQRMMLLNGAPAAPLLAAYLSLEQAAAELGVTTKTLHRWSQAKTGPPRIRLGQRLYYSRASVLGWLEQKERTAERAVAPPPPRGPGRKSRQ
jgi:predicted DNA-binding transcriptional regulator AlpA